MLPAPFVAITMCCSLAAPMWDDLLSNVTAHHTNLTAVIPESYVVGANGILTPSEFSNRTASHIPALHALGLKVYGMMPMTAGAITLAHDATARAAFFVQIKQIVADEGWDGFAIDLEGPHENATVAAELMQFLNEFGNQLQSIGPNHDLMAFIHTCPTADFNLQCSWFNTSASVNLITMDTYTADRTAWLRAFGGALVADPAHYLPGMEYNQNLSPYDNGPKNLNYMKAKGVNRLVAWNNVPPNQAYWDLFGEFLLSLIHI
eukprot:TRINITY_DN7550_c0_g2_i1.p1 TRINITY_DN7550_c0_g2~~TRINITY_DN7550_c0_g2_i1.p1  ORF type:complete len:262 (+),score=56.60 TRINITY_DN7550_c0_g2_i1:158-943(+)